MKRILILAAALVAVVAMSAADRNYVQGTLTKINVGHANSRVPTSLGNLLGQHDIFQVSVKVDDIIYTGETRAKEVSNFTIGDPVQVAFEDQYMYLRGGGNVSEVKAKVLTKERAEATGSK